MKKSARPSLGSALTALCLAGALATAVIGCSGAQTKQVTDGLKNANQVLGEASKAVNTAAGVVSDAQKLGQRVQSVANSVVQDRMVLVEKGDTLWGLASRAYRGLPQAPNGEGGYLWPVICERNALENCHLIEPGQVIRMIPASALDSVPLEQISWAIQAAYAAPDVRK